MTSPNKESGQKRLSGDIISHTKFCVTLPLIKIGGGKIGPSKPGNLQGMKVRLKGAKSGSSSCKMRGSPAQLRVARIARRGVPRGKD
tara:strand:- start:153 stop:413 length:261 start_codon:yes stop_codon:yes gene_type:complete